MIAQALGKDLTSWSTFVFLRERFVFPHFCRSILNTRTLDVGVNVNVKIRSDHWDQQLHEEWTFSILGGNNIGERVLRHLKSADFSFLPPGKQNYFEWLSFEKVLDRSGQSTGLCWGATDGSVRDHFLYGGQGGMDADVQPVLEIVPGVVLLQAKVVTVWWITDGFKILKSLMSHSYLGLKQQWSSFTQGLRREKDSFKIRKNAIDLIKHNAQYQSLFILI